MTMFARLFLLIGLVSSLSLGIVAGLLWRNSVSLERQLCQENDAAGIHVLQRGTALLEASLRDTHLMIVREKAGKVESYFTKIAGAVELQAALAQQFLTDSGEVSASPPLFEGNTLTGMARAKPSFGRDFVGRAPYVMFHLAPGVSKAKVAPELGRLRRLGSFFAHTQRGVPGCDSTYFGAESGFILGYPGGKTYFKQAYDPRARPWYLGAMQPGTAPGTLVWNVDFDREDPDRPEKVLLLTCVRTVTLPGAAKPVGVAAIDVKLPGVLEELFDIGNLRVSQAILTDDAARVRVRASYLAQGQGAPTFDIRNARDKPLAATVPQFAAVAAYIGKNPAKPTGVYWKGAERGVPMSRAATVFIYSAVNFSPGAAATGLKTPGDGGKWHYIVALPMRSLLAPLTSVRREMRGATDNISRAIAVRTRKSAALILALIGATLMVALGVAGVAARATSRPLMQMAQVARGVGEGNLEQQAPETSGGEIGEMGRAINAMIGGLKQRDLLQETFGLYTDASVVAEVLERGGVQLGGVKSVATVFFSDLAGFTSLSEQTPPETLIELLNEYFTAMTKIILESKGTFDKYIGDAVMAFWGHPIARDDDAARACQAALDQFEKLQILCDKWQSEGRPRLEMRIGIETGDVIVGSIGSKQKLNYTVLGDTVNLASRLEAVNKVYGTRILIGQTTRALAGDAIEVREIDLLAVMGKSQPVRVYELLGMAGTVAAAKMDGYRRYEIGLEAYRNRCWDEAQGHLQRAQLELGGDQACEVLMARIEKCRVAPPPPDWDGGAILERK